MGIFGGSKAKKKASGTAPMTSSKGNKGGAKAGGIAFDAPAASGEKKGKSNKKWWR